MLAHISWERKEAKFEETELTLQLFGFITVNVAYLFSLIYWSNLSLQTQWTRNIICLYTNEWYCD